MKDKNKHIRQRPDDKYPKPEVPVNGAWAGMKDMLDKGMPLRDSGSSSGSFNFNWLKAIKLMSVTALTSASLVYFIVSKKSADFPTKTKNETKKLLATEQLPTSNDSVSGKSADNQPSTTKTTSASNIVIDSSKEKSIELNPEVDPSVPTIHNESNSEPESKVSDLSSRKKQNTSSDKSRNGSAKPTAFASQGALDPKTNRGSGDKIRPSYNSTSQKKAFSSLPNKGQFRASHTIYGEALQNNGRNGGSQFADRRSSETAKNHREKNRLVNPKINVSLSSELGLERTSEKHLSAISFLVAKTTLPANNLEQTLTTIKVKSASIVFKPQQNIAKRTLLANIHGGLMWNLNALFSGYDWYFRGTNSTNFKGSSIPNEFYKVLLPGLWVGKTLKNGDEIVIKVKPYSQYFGSHKRPDSTKVRESDTTINYYTIKRSLLKSSGLNIGVQYNHAISERWSVGLGANLQWQQRALLGIEVKSSRRNSVVDYIPFASLKQSTDTSNYVKPIFIATNVELLYSWKKLQLGAGFGVPVTSMLGSRYRSLRPISGQVTVRWKLR